MYGVVVWSDLRKGKAVIWCEDHGDLAFYRGSETTPGRFDAGDLVKFDVRTDRNFRVACNAELVEENAHRGLTDFLNSREGSGRASASDMPARRVSRASIVPFPAQTRQRDERRAATCRRA